MDKVWAAIGLLTKHPVLVVTVTMLELTTRRNVEVTVARLLKDGEKYLDCSAILFNVVRNSRHY